MLGVVNQGEEFAGLAMTSLFNNLCQVREEIEREDIEIELVTRVVTQDSNSTFCDFARIQTNRLEVITPRDWGSLGLPPQANGSFATYWKFDLFNTLTDDEILFYIDADAIIRKKINLESLINRLSRLSLINSSSFRKGAILMTPSHRPNFERVGFKEINDPFRYFNAGLVLATGLPPITTEEILAVYKDFFFSDPSLLLWHDQDLINALFGSIIGSLPYRYNVSSGMLRSEYYGVAQINYIAELEFKDPVVAHASGGILNSNRHYPWRNDFKSIARSLAKNEELDDRMKADIESFIRQISTSRIKSMIHKIKNRKYH